ncbi:MAG: CtsR family transcriptional regulator [Eubacteriales bacterium]|jgi:transcriptional regulator CtsR|nr:CtsR family transcriptional regulator [Desulforudis sp.]MDQ7788676.1 CtsR family transcriptional regulator [Clostridia bacterium]MDZ4043619.1 CtsR family transcriptional regulator [Eubacteriales bacterium]MBV1735461.1 CtsR family transcriptional regulator [Desulforudis sp.]MBV1770641.1 CtsR family transcriptional regulator [Desulforudis sp.]
MPTIADYIAEHIKVLFNESDDVYIEIQRNDLAAKFGCAPSQINYVLATRFTTQSGFAVESRRGGGGFVRIFKLSAEQPGDLLRECYHRIGSSITAPDARSIIVRLRDEQIISEREAHLINVTVDDATLNLDSAWRNRLRANILKAMLASLARQCNAGGGS